MERFARLEGSDDSMSMNRIRPFFAFSALFLFGCVPVGDGSSSGGGEGDFQLHVCSLGCTSAGTCAIQQMSVNSDLVFTFSDDVDPNSVSFSSFNILSVESGTAPAGEFLVDGRDVIFRPALLDNASSTTFGFELDQAYRFTITSAASSSTVIRSITGDPNQSAIGCVVVASSIQDFIAGNPYAVVSPSELAPPTSTEFQIEITFNDIIPQSLLIDEDGKSETVLVEVVLEDAQGLQTELPMTGSFEMVHDLDVKSTLLTFTPDSAFPISAGGTRWAQVRIIQGIQDIAGNPLQNPGNFVIPLLDGDVSSETFTESFTEEGMEDPAGSTAGLWDTASGYLDSGLDPVTQFHYGGGSGVLGVGNLDVLALSTEDGATFTSTLFKDVEVTLSGSNAGVFLFEEITFQGGGGFSASGDQALRLYSRGSATIGGVLDLSGEDAKVNFGKHFRETELAVASPNTNPQEEFASSSFLNLMYNDSEADGGERGGSNLSGGEGGSGGRSWYIITAFNYYNPTGRTTYNSSNPENADSARYAQGPITGQVQGKNGGRIGGAPASGGNYTKGLAAEVVADRGAGSGMGSWAWPPLANRIPTDANDDVHAVFFVTGGGTELHCWRASQWIYEHFMLHRARGGGGGGYWQSGERGTFWDEFGMDPHGDPLLRPDVNRGGANPSWALNFDMNAVPHDYSGGWGSGLEPVLPYVDLLHWDALLDGGGGTTPDAAGGNAYYADGSVPFYSLNPSLGYLLGGAGGGGAGTSEHGSWESEASTTQSKGETFRSCDGGGGGAGGGALQLHVGGDLSVSGSISVEGGDGGDSAFMVSTTFNGTTIDPLGITDLLPGDAGGGGGSGGAVLLQVSGDISFGVNALNLQGGEGGTGSAGNYGGDGGSGILRIESPTPGLLNEMQGIVLPIEALNLDERPEFGVSGPNWTTFQGRLDGDLGDVSITPIVGGGAPLLINGNASGVRSQWIEFSPDNLFYQIEDWSMSCSWSDGLGNSGVLTYDNTTPPIPGVDPIWVAFQTGWGVANQFNILEPNAGTEGDWIIPGFNAVSGGVAEINSAVVVPRIFRYQVIFDQDQVAAQIGNAAGAYFHVDELTIDWVN